MNLIKINGEKEWDKSQYEYSQCLQASTAHSSCQHPVTPARHGGASLPLAVSSTSGSSGHCSSALEAAPSLPSSLFARMGDGEQPGSRCRRACRHALGKQPMPLAGGFHPHLTEPSVATEADSQAIFPLVLVWEFSRGERKQSDCLSQSGNSLRKRVLPTGTHGINCNTLGHPRCRARAGNSLGHKCRAGRGLLPMAVQLLRDPLQTMNHHGSENGSKRTGEGSSRKRECREGNGEASTLLIPKGAV